MSFVGNRGTFTRGYRAVILDMAFSTTWHISWFACSASLSTSYTVSWWVHPLGQFLLSPRCCLLHFSLSGGFFLLVFVAIVVNVVVCFIFKAQIMLCVELPRNRVIIFSLFSGKYKDDRVLVCWEANNLIASFLGPGIIWQAALGFQPSNIYLIHWLSSFIRDR